MTINSYPPAYSSINSDLIWVTYDAHSTDATTYPNYKYVADLYINSVLVFRSKVFQRPDNNRGIFNLGAIIREYVVSSLKQEQGKGEFSIDVVVKFGEEYGGVTYTNLLVDSTRTFFNHYNGRFNDFTYLTPDIVASNRPKTIQIFSANDKYYLPYFRHTNSSFNIVINGVTTTITPTTGDTMQSLNIAIGSATDYNVVLGGLTYNVQVICEPLYQNYPVHFLNKFGGWESFNFFKVSKKSYDVERKKFQQLPYRVDGSGVVSLKTGSIMNNQTNVFSSSITERLKISSDFLSDDEYQWLAQLVTSPCVYLQDGSTLYPVQIAESNYEFKQHIVDKLTNLSLTLSFGSTFKSQYQ